MRNLRRVKTPWEIGHTCIAARKHEATYSEIPECFRPGMTDLEFQYVIEKRVCARTARLVFSVLSEPIWISIWAVFSPGKNAETPSPFDFALGGGGIDASCPLGANGTLLKEGTANHGGYGRNYTAYMTEHPAAGGLYPSAPAAGLAADRPQRQRTALDERFKRLVVQSLDYAPTGSYYHISTVSNR